MGKWVQRLGSTQGSDPQVQWVGTKLKLILLLPGILMQKLLFLLGILMQKLLFHLGILMQKELFLCLNALFKEGRAQGLLRERRHLASTNLMNTDYLLV